MHLKKLKLHFLMWSLDTPISSLDERFQSLGEVNNTSSVLHEITNLGREDLLRKCQPLSTALTNASEPNIDGIALTQEIEYFPPLPSNNMMRMEILAFLHTNC
ncbi:unnamed protein product [Lepeophtheirus salmonis]|uniref:(salmon louse) hypothetical protein n=1 Tax=Lepeophtheirus salmonis TaxID=72036 RepID=A0A7R8HC29_LEPSM|nr:unnamed protein product [Lepeophtheirus salmonis]CAF3005654.1 unnamed protein product [Lepeophtheirus salmonis]